VLENTSCRAACVGKSPESRLLAKGNRPSALASTIANFAGGVRQGDLLFISGRGPVTDDGQQAGKVGRMSERMKPIGCTSCGPEPLDPKCASFSAHWTMSHES
jgi:hypothetical protein